MRLRVPLVAALLLALSLSCERRVLGTSDVLITAPTFEGRVDAALAAAPSTRLSLDASQALGAVEGGLRIDRPDQVSGLPEGLKPGALLEDPAVRQALLGAEESAAAELLHKQGVRLIAVHRSLAPSIDRGRTVLSRIYHHDQLSYFSLTRVTDGLFFYEVLEKPITFPPQLAGFCIAYLRHRLAGNAPSAFPDVKSETGRWTLLATLRARQGGQELTVAIGQDGKLQNALEELIADLERDHRRNVEPLGFAPLAQGLDDLVLEIHRVTERAYIEPRDEETLEGLWEMGIDGAYLMTGDRKERAALPGSVAYTRAITTADAFLRAAAAQGHMSEKRPWRDNDAWLEVLRTSHYMEVPGKGVVPLYRGVPPVPLESVTLQSVRDAILASGEWYLNNLAPNGQVTYKVWPSENRYSNEYNHVRHTLATWNLVQAWTLDPRPEFLEGARRALDWTNRYLKEEGDMTYYSYNDNQKLGSAVVSMLGIIDLAEATDDHQYDELLKRLGRFTQFMQVESGTFNGYHVPKGHPYYGQQNDIVPGEAALALVRLAEYTDDDQWIAGLPKFWDYYEPWFKTRAARRSDESPWPAYLYDNQTRLDLVQFGPWTVMAANAYHRRTGDERVAKLGLEIARWMIEAYEWDSPRVPFPDYLGGYYKLAHELPAMQAFCYAEGTAAAYQLALRMAPDEAAYFEQKTRESVRFGLNMQYNALSVYPFTRPREVLGGIRYAMNETKVRIDYVYHAQSAMFQWLQAAKQDPNLPEKVRGALASAPTPENPATVPDENSSTEATRPAPAEVRLGLSWRPILPSGVGGRPAGLNLDDPHAAGGGSEADDGENGE